MQEIMAYAAAVGSRAAQAEGAKGVYRQRQ
jgi:hypothetical protein